MTDVVPPEDADAWSDAEWIEWLDSTDDDGAPQPYVPSKPKSRSVGGQMLGAAMLGFAEIFYGKREEKQVEVAPAPGPPDDEDITVILDADDPANSEIKFRR